MQHKLGHCLQSLQMLACKPTSSAELEGVYSPQACSRSIEQPMGDMALEV